MKDFANYLKHLRLETKLTQTQFAAKLNIDTAALSKIENGKKDFGEKIALELYTNNCPVITFKVAEKKFRYFEGNA